MTKKIIIGIIILLLGIGVVMYARKRTSTLPGNDTKATSPHPEIIIRNQLPENGFFIFEKVIITEPGFLVVIETPVADIWATSTMLAPGTYENLKIPVASWYNKKEYHPRSCANLFASLSTDANGDGIFGDGDYLRNVGPIESSALFSTRTDGKGCVVNMNPPERPSN